MMSLCSILFPFAGLLAAAAPAAGEFSQPSDSRFRIKVPKVVLTDVPVSRIVITALDLEGNVDTTYNGQPLITGIRLATKRSDDSKLGAFRDGVLELTTDLAEGRKVYIIESEIIVDPESRWRGYLAVHRTWEWFSLTPPLLAVLLAIWLRNVIIALFAAVWSGAVILAHGNFFTGFMRTLDTFFIDELVQPGAVEHSHMMIILFTMFLGAMIGVMARSGGTHALVSSLTRYTSKREHGQLMTWALGLVVFFDDYANTLMVGSTMRPVTDRLRISREKLAFLVDSTAAPVAGLALVSTWVGFEIGQIEKAFADLGIETNVYTTFLATIPYRFYPLHLIVFVWLIAHTGHDFGPMLKAEARALAHGQLSRPGVTVPAAETDLQEDNQGRRHLLRNALIPLGTLLVLLVVGFWWTGHEGLKQVNQDLIQQEKAEIPITFWSVLSMSRQNRVLFVSSFVASIAAIASVVISRSLSLNESIEAWLDGLKSMFLAVLILVMAWAVATLCDADHLNTAAFLVEFSHGQISASWMPCLAFLLAAAVSFATGSSWSTMGLLMPLFISVTYYILVAENDFNPNHHLMLATIGAVLAGAIFGDHCSPISDTTVLSSAAAGSDHLDHVATQLPYAASVALVSLVLGYLPVGFGYSPIVLLPLGLIVLYLLVQFLGRPVAEYAKSLKPADKPDSSEEAKAADTPSAKRPAADSPAVSRS